MKYAIKKSKGILLENRVIIFDEKISKTLLEKEFLGKPFGKFIQLSLVETLYLSEKNFLDVFTLDGKKITKNDLENVFQKLPKR